MRKLYKIGYLRFTRKPLCRAGMFFVHKSDGERIRLIVDARPANQIFHKPPGVELCTGEGFSRIELEVPVNIKPGTREFEEHLRSRGLVFGLADVKDCFHRMKQPHWLSRYFAWEEAPATWFDGLVGTEVEGATVLAEESLFPIPSSLCMGFSWSLFFAQRANEHLISQVPRLIDSKLISDRGEPVVFDPNHEERIRHYVYVDNLGIVSQQESGVLEALGSLDPAFDARGLVLHPGEVQKEDIRALGYVR